MLEPNTDWCLCGMQIINGKCSRRHPIKACKGEQTERKPKFSGYSKFYQEQKGYQNK